MCAIATDTSILRIEEKKRKEMQDYCNLDDMCGTPFSREIAWRLKGLGLQELVPFGQLIV